MDVSICRSVLNGVKCAGLRISRIIFWLESGCVAGTKRSSVWKKWACWARGVWLRAW